ncbi:MAG: glycosyltransferase [Chloroflexi bacterium]|nr:glycosyltransferase [Chloroflexota bacterium]
MRRRFLGQRRGLGAALSGLPSRTKRGLTLAAVLLGAVVMVYYYAWWFELGRGGTIYLAPLLAFAILYNAAQVFAAWYIYANIASPPERRAPSGLSVDVLLPVYDEDYPLAARSLAATIDMAYPHRTFLLDDAQSDAFRKLADRLGAVYLRRRDRHHAKAGNVNHALQFSDAEFVTVFDVDHIPAPDFLDRVLGYFDDPRVGFVQALVAHGNQRETFIARAAADQSYDVFSPTSMGMYGCGAALVWGAHCTFRRAALESIGGHQTGLAEDLHTSLALHAAGWRSVYVPHVVARGLVPADLRAYFVQQLKWSRGVFEILLERSLPLLVRLRPAQFVCYATRMTYYLLGPVALINMLALVLMLFFGERLGEHHLVSYLFHFAPAAFTVLLIRTLVLAMWERDPEAGGFHMPGVALALGTWPIYVLSLLCALLRVRVPHLPTPKQVRGGPYLALVLPQLVMVCLLAAGLAWRIARGVDWAALIIIGFALLMITMHWAVFYGVWEGWRLQRRYRHGAAPVLSRALRRARQPL